MANIRRRLQHESAIVSLASSYDRTEDVESNDLEGHAGRVVAGEIPFIHSFPSPKLAFRIAYLGSSAGHDSGRSDNHKFQKVDWCEIRDPNRVRCDSISHGSRHREIGEERCALESKLEVYFDTLYSDSMSAYIQMSL